jgi:hypothetical protein
MSSTNHAVPSTNGHPQDTPASGDLDRLVAQLVGLALAAPTERYSYTLAGVVHALHCLHNELDDLMSEIEDAATVMDRLADELTAHVHAPRRRGRRFRLRRRRQPATRNKEEESR